MQKKNINYTFLSLSKMERWHSFYGSNVIFNKVAYLLKYALPLTVVLWIMPRYKNLMCARFH